MPLKPETTIPFDEDDIQEITALAKNSEKLPELVSGSSQAGPKMGTVSISRALSKKIGLGFQEINLMVNSLVHLYRLRDRSSASGEEVADIVTRSLGRANQTDLVKVWKEAQEKVIQALNELNEEHPLIVTFEAGTTSLPNAILSMELFTDTRPVFNESKDKILFTIITHTLSLEYHDSYRHHKQIHVSLDASDLEMLRLLCEEAEQAAETLKASIQGPSAIIGERDAETQ